MSSRYLEDADWARHRVSQRAWGLARGSGCEGLESPLWAKKEGGGSPRLKPPTVHQAPVGFGRAE